MSGNGANVGRRVLLSLLMLAAVGAAVVTRVGVAARTACRPAGTRPVRLASSGTTRV